uniref:Inactive pancreatic lipase-related protein 1 n=1 Tax=Cacopsylla melanoneura TaxID=428564 RepID=A0A8D8LSJ2_9HEMI
MGKIIRSVFVILLLSKMEIINGNTVDQMYEQLKNMSLSALDFHDIENYMADFKERYLANNELCEHVYFWLYTRHNRNEKQVLLIDDPDSILDSDFSIDKKTVVVVHGWLNAANTSFAYILKNTYLDSGDYNVISVDWSELASNLIYPVARFSIKYIGQQVAAMLATVVRTTGYDWDQFHLVGHSLGAHVCGIAGEYVAHDKIGRITGLDPALPLFSSDPNGRLDPTDAEFVDVIHTCGGYLGFFEPCGHADFYPNRGKYIQPGCGFDFGTCSHLRSYEYFAESLATKIGFYARQCDSWDDYQQGSCNGTADDIILMGEHVNISAQGTYYLLTATSGPYAMGRYFPSKKDEYIPDWWFNRAKIRMVNTVQLWTNSIYSWFI